MESFHFKTSLLIYITLAIYLYNTSNSLAYICLYAYAYITYAYIAYAYIAYA